MLKLARNVLVKLNRDTSAARLFSSMGSRPKFNPEDHGLDKEFRLTDFTKMKG